MKGRWGRVGGELTDEQLTAIDTFLDAQKPRLNALKAVAPPVRSAVAPAVPLV